MREVNWKSVLLFFVIACAWSWPWFWLRDMVPEQWAALRVPYPLKSALLMWGPGIAALVCLRVFRGAHTRTITMVGGRALRSVAFYAVPILGLAAVGVESAEFGDARVHLMVLAIGIVGFVNILGEEMGWRGFLQDAVRPLARPGRYALIGLMWVGWHFTNLFAHRGSAELAQYLAWYIPLTIALSALIGEATDRTRAVLIAVTLHSWVNMLWEFSGMGTYLVFGGSILFWAWMLATWPTGARPDRIAAGEAGVVASGAPPASAFDGVNRHH